MGGYDVPQQVTAAASAKGNRSTSSMSLACWSVGAVVSASTTVITKKGSAPGSWNR